MPVYSSTFDRRPRPSFAYTFDLPEFDEYAAVLCCDVHETALLLMNPYAGDIRVSTTNTTGIWCIGDQAHVYKSYDGWPIRHEYMHIRCMHTFTRQGWATFANHVEAMTPGEIKDMFANIDFALLRENDCDI
jgi:hypothetical protein